MKAPLNSPPYIDRHLGKTPGKKAPPFIDRLDESAKAGKHANTSAPAIP